MTTPSVPTGTKHTDPLVDRSCVLLDGRCNCERPVLDNCKYMKKVASNG